MPVFLIIFLTMGVLSFGIVAFAIRPTMEQKALQQRIVTMAVSGTGTIAQEEASQLLKRVKSSPFDWVSDRLQGSWISTAVQKLILQSNSNSTEGGIMITAAGLGLAAGTFIYAIGSGAFALPAAVAGGFMPILMLKIKRSRRLKAFDKAMPDCIDMMARSLRAGHSLQAALSIVAEQALEPAKREFAEVFKQQNYGMPLRDALMQLLDRVPSQDLRVLVTGILVQKDTGGNLAEMLDKIVAVIRERMKIKGEIKTHTAQGRMTGWVLCALPIAMLLAINVINPGYSSALFTTTLGHYALYIGGGLLIAGGFIIRAIINGIEV